MTTSKVCEASVEKEWVAGNGVGGHDGVYLDVSWLHNGMSTMSEGLTITDCFSLSLSWSESVIGPLDALNEGIGLDSIADLSSQFRQV